MDNEIMTITDVNFLFYVDISELSGLLAVSPCLAVKSKNSLRSWLPNQ